VIIALSPPRKLIGGSVMNKKPHTYNSYYADFLSWIEDTKQHELTQLIDLVEHAKVWLKSAESIPEEKCLQFIDNLTLDLQEFYQQSRTEIKHSLYSKIVEESFWSNVSHMTDQTQVEWAELMEDFEHKGLYHVGEFVGFGEVECLSCHNVQSIFHLVELTPCIKCEGITFTRKSLTT